MNEDDAEQHPESSAENETSTTDTMESIDELVSRTNVSKSGRAWDLVQLLISIGAVVTFLAWLLFRPTGHQEAAIAPAKKAAEVSVSPNGSILVMPETPLGKRLRLWPVASTETTDPIMKVTGLVIASRRPGKESKPDYWQFYTEDLLITYSDWERARADSEYYRSLVEKVRSLDNATEEGLRAAIQRMEKLVQTGTETAKDLETLRMQLVKSELQTNKDVYEAEAEERIATKNLATLGLKLSRFGLSPDFMESASSDIDVLAIDVPEGMLNLVKQGQSVVAQFFGLPKDSFRGKVQSMSPVLTSQQRTLRVMVTLHDPDDRLRPGMYATIGLGVDAREVIRIPANSVLHIGQLDYVLRQKAEKLGETSIANESLTFELAEVLVGDLKDGKVTLEEGLQAGDTIIGDNAILLKPLAMRSLGMRNQPSLPETPEGENQSRNGATF